MQKLLLLLSAAVIMAATSCSKKEGCTNSNANNYCTDCEKDDGSCSYSGNYVAWWKQPFRDSCAAHGIANLQVFFDGTFEGTLPVSAQYWNSAPACNTSGTLTISKTWTGSVSKDFSAVIKLLDGSGNVIATVPAGTVTLTAKQCKQDEATW